MLEARHIAGDSELSALLIGGARRQWRTGIASRFDELVEHTQCALAAQRSDRPPRRARPQVRPGRSARRPTAQRAGHRPARRCLPQPLAGLPDRFARRCASGAAERTHRAASGVQAWARSAAWRSSPTRSALRCASATGSTWPGCSPMPPAPSATTSTPDCARRPMRCPRRGFAALRRPVRRPLDEGVIEFAGEVILARRRPAGTRSRSDPAGGGRLGDHRHADVAVRR